MYKLSRKILIAGLLAMLCAPPADAGCDGFREHHVPPGDNHVLFPIETTAMKSGEAADVDSFRKENCLRTARLIGAFAGSFMGCAHMYWRATDVSGPQGAMWKNVLTAIPSIMIGAYAGSRSTVWTTERIMKGNPKVGRAALKGAGYGAIDGAIILTSSIVPLFITAYYADTIDFNFSGDDKLLNIIGAAVAGGLLYGGTFGAMIGTAYGPGISLYMRF